MMFVVCFAMNAPVIMQEKVKMTLIIGITNIKNKINHQINHTGSTDRKRIEIYSFYWGW